MEKGKGRGKENGEEEKGKRRGKEKSKGKEKGKEKGKVKGKGKGRWTEVSLRNVGRTDARTSGDFTLCPMLSIALDRQKLTGLELCVRTM